MSMTTIKKEAIRNRPQELRPPEVDPALSSTQVDLLVDGVDDGVGTVVALRDGIATVRFEQRRPPRVVVGGAARLRLRVRGLRRPLEAPVQVQTRADIDDGRNYGCALPEMGEPGGALTAALAALFNRRSNFRVRPVPMSLVPVKLESEQGDLQATGPLADISAGGLSIKVDPEVEEVFADVQRVRVSVNLPDRDGGVQLLASIRSRRLSGRQVRYGLEFELDPERRQGSARAILGYVMDRQRENLREAVLAGQSRQP
jgi:hypothetical protein